MRAALISTCTLLVLAGCKPDFGSPPSLIGGPRVLAVRGTPAEAPPGMAVTFDALAVDASGTITLPGLSWAVCHEPKPPAETNAVSGACLGIPDDAGPAPTFMTSIPADACMLFGPQTPPAKSGQPPIRPRDPDVTGGFYQPVRVAVQAANGSDTAFELQRITCPLAGAPIDVTLTFNMTYTPNQNPAIAAVTLDPDGAVTPRAGPGVTTTATVSPGAKVTLQLTWSDGTAEPYPLWDLATRSLTTKRESLRASWFATDGVFALDTSGRGEDEDATLTFTRNDWTAPAGRSSVHFWVVLRDSRGGLDFAAFDVEVIP
jgi:hypothetical protein